MIIFNILQIDGQEKKPRQFKEVKKQEENKVLFHSNQIETIKTEQGVCNKK